MPDGTPSRYFLKCASGKGAHALTQGEFHSATNINSIVGGLVPKPVGHGEYQDGQKTVYFFLCAFHDLDFSTPPEPAGFISSIVKLHEGGKSPTGMFGYPVPVVCGKMERTVKWEQSWAESYVHQLKDVIRYDNEINGPWPKYDAACKQLIDVGIPRLLGVVQSDGRSITPTLIQYVFYNLYY